MLHSVMQDLKGDAIVARDGVIGSVEDVYFDDQRWAVRYLVVDTGKWLPGRKVLISPVSVSSQGDDAAIHVDLTRAQVERAPGIGQDAPISRLLEAAHADHYRYPYYWSGPYLWGIVPVPYHGPPAEGRASQEMRRMAEQQQAAESQLRSSAEVVGYMIRAADGDIGHVEDFLVDEQSWAITDMVVDTRNWLPGKKVLVPPEAIETVDWHAQQVNVRFTREALKRA